jgi:hypothetical protein
MRIRRRKEPTRRQRVVQEGSPKIANFAYTSSRQAQPERLSRQDLADQAKISSRHPSLFWLQRIGLLVVLVAVVATAVDALSLSPSVKVVDLNQAAGRTYLQPNQVYAAAADSILKHTVWDRSKVTVDADGLSQQMLQQFPELTNVSVTMPLLAHQPIVYIQAPQPALTLNTANGTYIIGNSGKALARLTTSAAGPAELPYLIDQSGLNVKLHQQAMSTGDVEFIQAVVAQLAAKGFTVSTLTLPATSREVDAHVEGQPYFIKFNLQDNDPAGEAGTFFATIASLKKQNITPAQYVDVRVDGRAYYQ